MRVFGVIFFFTTTVTLAQEDEMSFALLRQNDKLAVPSDSLEQDPSMYEKIKSIPMGRNSTLTLGGSHRFQIESFVNEQFGSLAVKDNIWFLNRTMLHAHLYLGKRFQFFGELNSSQITGKEALVPVDRDELSINQLFMTYTFNDRWSLLLGRENFRLGSGRLIDVREGPNVRLSFDQIKLMYRSTTTDINAFIAIPVRPEPGVFDNEALATNEFVGGLYATKRLGPALNFDIYYLFKMEEDKVWNKGIGDDERSSIGIRHFGKLNKLRFNNEFVYQFGDFDTQKISAWTASFNIEGDIQLFGHPFTLGLKTEAISGDGDREDVRLNTFDGLYPRGAYFGRVARFGPSNLIDVHPYLNTAIGKFY
ncbi:MAG: alginate export family protein, partial [Bacteroidota bacterium]